MSSTEKDGGETERGEERVRGEWRGFWGGGGRRRSARCARSIFAGAVKKTFDRGGARARVASLHLCAKTRAATVGLVARAGVWVRARGARRGYRRTSLAGVGERALAHARAVEALASETRRGGGEGWSREDARGVGGAFASALFHLSRCVSTWLSLRRREEIVASSRGGRGGICGRPGVDGAVDARERGVDVVLRRRRAGEVPEDDLEDVVLRVRVGRGGREVGRQGAVGASPPASGGKKKRRGDFRSVGRAGRGGGSERGEATHGQRRDVHLAACAPAGLARPPDRKRLRVARRALPEPRRGRRVHPARGAVHTPSPPSSRERRRPHFRTTRRPRLALRPRRGSNAPSARTRPVPRPPTPRSRARARARAPRDAARGNADGGAAPPEARAEEKRPRRHERGAPLVARGAD